MYKGCDRMRNGSCQFYKEHIAGYDRRWSDGTKYNSTMEYNTYCNSFDNFENCPYYSYRNFNNQQIRDQYKKNQNDDAKGSLITLVIIVVIVAFVLKGCGVF